MAQSLSRHTSSDSSRVVAVADVKKMKNCAVLLVSACAAVTGIAYGMYSPMVAVFSRDVLGADYSQVGLIGMVNYLPYMFAPLFVGMLLDRLNKSYILLCGILLNVFSVLLLSTVQSIPEVLLFRMIAGLAHSLFWPSSEVLISTNSTADSRVKSIAMFTAAWVLGFAIGPLIGKTVLSVFDYRVLFTLAAGVLGAGIIPAIMLRGYGRPPSVHVTKSEELAFRTGTKQIIKEMTSNPSVSAVLLYYAITFGVVLTIYPAYMRETSLTDQDIEVLFFVFGLSRFATLYFVQRIAKHGTKALAVAVAAAAVGMLISFESNSILSFAIAMVLIGFATSIFYPVTFNIVTRDTPVGQMGSKLGIYETIYGIGWTAGPIAIGLSSDAFGSTSPYLAFFIAGTILAGSIMIFRKDNS